MRVVPGGSEAASGGKDPKEATSKLDLKAVYDKVENRFKRNGKESSSSNGKTANSSTTQNSALVVSKSGGGGGGLIANGTGVLSNNNNSTLRNRRGGGKKEQQQASNLSNSKLADKSNNQKSSSPSVEDNSLNGGFSKKNKENSPSSVGGDSGGVPSSSNSSKKKKGGGGGGGGGGGQASSSNNTSSPLSASSTNAQVSSSTKKKRHRSGGGSGGSLSNVCLVTGSSSGKGLSKAEQEETSSTTTESSNSDDFYISPSDKKILNNHQNHQRKGSRANSPEDSSSCSGTSHSAGGGGGGGGKGKKDGKKNKQGNDGKLDGDLLGSVDMSTVSGMIQKGGSPSTDDGCPSGKKKNGKRKEQQNNMFSLDSSQIGKTVSDGKTSPVSAAAQARHQMHAHHSVPGMHHPYHHHDMAMWDSPQRPMGDGLSELAAQTEAFVMHRPATGNNGKKSGSGEHLMGQPSYVDGRLARSSHSPPMVNALQMANYQAQAQQQQMHLGGNVSANLRHRRHAGIIGQRYGPPPPGGMGVLSPSSSFYQQQNGSARQHTPPTRVGGGAPGLSGVGGAGSGWGTDILPDNGCDIWSRKSSLDNNGASGGGGGAMAQTFSSVAGSASSASSTLANDLPPMYSTGNMVPPGYSALFEGFPASSSPGLSNRSSDDGGYYSLGSAGGNNGTGVAGGTMVSSVAGASGSNARNGVARNSADNSQLFGYGMEIFNSLNLPLSSTYDMGGYRSSVSTSTAAVRAPQVSMSGAGPATGAPSHNYLHRMRSEPVAREEPRGFGTTSSKLITWSYSKVLIFLVDSDF